MKTLSILNPRFEKYDINLQNTNRKMKQKQQRLDESRMFCSNSLALVASRAKLVRSIKSELAKMKKPRRNNILKKCAKNKGQCAFWAKTRAIISISFILRINAMFRERDGNSECTAHRALKMIPGMKMHRK